VSADQITRDIARKCGDDVSAAIHRNMALVGGATPMAQVAFSGAASAFGAAAGSVLAVHRLTGGEPVTTDEVLERVWSIIRPLAVRSLADAGVSGLKGGAA
jgi:hypothetical protein